MKKIYKAPQMEAVEVKLQGVIAGSPTPPKYVGSGSGSADAPAMPDFEEELTNLQNSTLW
ncbi:MAG: hypothetical protein Q4D25_08220 [Bacteroidales bacterium]|jgi:hypothetical protein|nr:hypothetical protein [Bacteroidales bacterium]